MPDSIAPIPVMSSPVIDLANCHASARNYQPEPVSSALVETIVAAAQRTSSSSNLQSYSVVAVTEPATRRQLAEMCGNQKHVAEAPVVLVWCADLARLDRVCELRGYSQVTDYVENFLIAAVDAAIAAQTAALAAESLGLGICYIGSIRNRPQGVIDLLHLPRLVFPVTGLTLGWPATEAAIRPRLPLPAVLHWETYDTGGQDKALYAYDRAMVASRIYEGRQVPVPGQPERVEDYGWMEHSARRVAQVVRADMRGVLEKQGFALK